MEPAITSGLENPIWGSDWATVRGRWSLDPTVAHLNHGSFGAVPIPVQATQDRLREAAEMNPNAFFSRVLPAKMEEARVTAAAFLRADPDGFVFVPNATTGVETVLSSVGLGPKQEVLITDHAYGAVRMAAERACSRLGAELVVRQVPIRVEGAEGLAEAVLGGVTERTRLAIVDHIASPTAVLFPIGELVTGLRSRAVLSLVDAAHAPGMVDVDLASLDPDFWTGNFHKWCCSPRGAAGLFVRREHRERTMPVVTSWYAGEGLIKAFGWLGTQDYSPYLSVPSALEFLESLGWERLRRHNRELAHLGRQGVTEAMGAEALAKEANEFFEAMTLVPLPGGLVSTEEEARALQARIGDELRCEVAVTVWRNRGFLRLSAQAYNAPAEYERLGVGVKSLLAL
jgi:isopenicillin-N epimerase